jgi:uncharacterized protein (DUF934 family)
MYPFEQIDETLVSLNSIDVSMPVPEKQSESKLVIRLVGGKSVVGEEVWLLIRDEAEVAARLRSDASENARLIVPVSSYLAIAMADPLAAEQIGVWVPPDPGFEFYASELVGAPLIAVDFPFFLDGRGLSMGFLLRSQLGYRGELRAVGDVLTGQLENMRRCGFNSFAIRPDKSVPDALEISGKVSVCYHRMTVELRSPFRKPVVAMVVEAD